jgi:N-acetylmuramoyl-L-alanine amidase
LGIWAAMAARLDSRTQGGDLPVRAEIAPGMTAVLGSDQELYLEAQPRKGEGLLRFTSRLCGSADVADLIVEINNIGRKLLAGVDYRIPFDLLAADLQLMVVKVMFENDRAEAAGWRHEVNASGKLGSESLWHISRWFTGRGENYRAIRLSNGLVEEDLAPGQVVLIPANLLRPSFRAALPASSPYHLGYGRDSEGDYAVYRLKPGEALYTAVVMRFMGQVFAEDVNKLSSEVARRSGIKDVRDIPVGFEVKIPFEQLLPEYLPPGHERRRDYEQQLQASARFSNQVRASSLQGVTVVLDAGHGGADVGASSSGVWESIYVYDIMVRAKRLLEAATAAVAISTTQDGGGYEIPERNRLSNSKSHRVLTTPNYTIQDSRVGVHLRWYLANSIYRQALAKGTDPGKVVFVSIHADSLHPSLRGAMVYVPAAEYRTGTFGKTGRVYTTRSEVREKPRVSYTSRDRIQSEGLSRDLAGHILDSFRSSHLPVHPDKPIRGKIIRGRRQYVPAVIRFNAIPSKVLVEVCNLANSSDRKLIQTQEFRQQVAESIVKGILSYYGQAEGASELLVAVAGG